MPIISPKNNALGEGRIVPLEEHVMLAVCSYQGLDKTEPDVLALLTRRELIQFIVLAQVPNKRAAVVLGQKLGSVNRIAGCISEKLGTYHRGAWMKWGIKQGLIV